MRARAPAVLLLDEEDVARGRARVRVPGVPVEGEASQPGRVGLPDAPAGQVVVGDAPYDSRPGGGGGGGGRQPAGRIERRPVGTRAGDVPDDEALEGRVLAPRRPRRLPDVDDVVRRVVRREEAVLVGERQAQAVRLPLGPEGHLNPPPPAASARGRDDVKRRGEVAMRGGPDAVRLLASLLLAPLDHQDVVAQAHPPDDLAARVEGHLGLVAARQVPRPVHDGRGGASSGGGGIHQDALPRRKRPHGVPVVKGGRLIIQPQEPVPRRDAPEPGAPRDVHLVDPPGRRAAQVVVSPCQRRKDGRPVLLLERPVAARAQVPAEGAALDRPREVQEDEADAQVGPYERRAHVTRDAARREGLGRREVRHDFEKHRVGEESEVHGRGVA